MTDTLTPAQRSKTMKAVKSKDSKIELRLRSALWKRGYRYRKNCKDVFGKPDIVFKSFKIAVFCDSEFWHGYNWENRKYDIKSNKEYWIPKIERNIERDLEVSKQLKKEGWNVLRFWGNQIKKDLDSCLNKIEKLIIEKKRIKNLKKLSSHIKRIKNIDDLKSSQNNNFRDLTRELTLLSHKALEDWNSKKIENEKEIPFQVLDFFCGAGGMSLGFAAVSKVIPAFEIIGGCDIETDALQTFSNNFRTPAINQDISLLVDNEDIANSFVSKIEKLNNNKPLIVIGCAPCQGFTSHRKKNWAKEDERNTLIGAFSSFVVKLNPVCIVMENVPEMLSKKYWHHFLEAKVEFEKAGYVVKQSIYNAASFGVPQERFRAIVIAFKKDFLLPEGLLKPNDFVTVADAIGNLPPVLPGKKHPEDEFHQSANHRKSTIETIKAIPKDGGSRPRGVGPKCLDKVNGFYDVYGRLHWNKPSITITHYARNPASGRFVHPEQHRGLTKREVSILQSFPKNFEFSGSFDGIFKQIGEAVPPKLACGVASNILIELLSRAPQKDEIENSVPSILEPVSSSYSSVIAGIKNGRK